MTLSIAKQVALETYVTLRRGTACRLRRSDRAGMPRGAIRNDDQHIDAAVAWLLSAQEATPDDGVSAMYSLIQGWVGSYAETTGYIIPTLIDVSERRGDEWLQQRALRMADWLLGQQLDNGAFPGAFVGRTAPARVFNTGQVIFGLVRAGFVTEDQRYVDAALRAGDWLLAVQDTDGGWRRWVFNDTPHTYNVRTAWALLQLAQASGETRYSDAGLAGARWAAMRQHDNGWFSDNAFVAGARRTTLHTFVYALRGLLECGASTGEQPLVDAARLAADAILQTWRRAAFVPGCFSADFSATAMWRCLPGEAQLCAAWLRLTEITGQPIYRQAAERLLASLKALQAVNATRPEVRGGLSGSYPINGGYERYCLVNWGPKFLIDALILKGRQDDSSTRPRDTPSGRRLA